MDLDVTFEAGRNIAMKVPPHVYDATVRFYREVLCLPEIAAHAPSVVFEFGTNRLWIDRVPGISQAETWLEVVTNDLEAASALLAEAGVVRCDDIEPLPPGRLRCRSGGWMTKIATRVARRGPAVRGQGGPGARRRGFGGSVYHAGMKTVERKGAVGAVSVGWLRVRSSADWWRGVGGSADPRKRWLAA